MAAVELLNATKANGNSKQMGVLDFSKGKKGSGGGDDAFVEESLGLCRCLLRLNVDKEDTKAISGWLKDLSQRLDELTEELPDAEKLLETLRRAFAGYSTQARRIAGEDAQTHVEVPQLLSSSRKHGYPFAQNGGGAVPDTSKAQEHLNNELRLHEGIQRVIELCETLEQMEGLLEADNLSPIARTELLELAEDVDFETKEILAVRALHFEYSEMLRCFSRVAEKTYWILSQPDEVFPGPKTLDELPSSLQEELRPYLRVGFNPVFGATDTNQPGSQLGGEPWLPNGVEKPSCERCGKTMPLLLQLRLDALPTEVPKLGNGLLQVFYCLNKYECDENFEPYGTSVVVQQVDPTSPGEAAEESEGSLPLKAIVDWEKKTEIPSGGERLDLEDLELEEEDEALLENVGYRDSNDHLWGWPKWRYSPTYSYCRVCDSEMRYVFEVASEAGLPINFGDNAFGHLMQCEEHPDEWAFFWS